MIEFHIIINKMNPSYHQYSKGFGKIAIQDDNQSFRFQDYGYDHSSFFVNLIGEPDQSKEFRKEKGAQQEPTSAITQALNRQEEMTSSASQSFGHIQSEPTIINLRKQVFQGGKNDTMELCINFKTMLGAFFRERQVLNELSDQQINLLNSFNRRSPSLKSMALFFKSNSGNRNILEITKHLFSSSQCIRRILKSRCKTKNKLQMIKFIERMRMNTAKNGLVTKWKDEIRQSQ